MPRDNSRTEESRVAAPAKPDLPREARILMRAAELVERGHCKENLFVPYLGYDSDLSLCEIKQVCLRGAVIVALAEDAGMVGIGWGTLPDDTGILSGRIYDVMALVDFNNALETTPAMVADRLRDLASSYLSERK